MIENNIPAASSSVFEWLVEWPTSRRDRKKSSCWKKYIRNWKEREKAVGNHVETVQLPHIEYYTYNRHCQFDDLHHLLKQPWPPDLHQNWRKIWEIPKCDSSLRRSTCTSELMVTFNVSSRPCWYNNSWTAANAVDTPNNNRSAILACIIGGYLLK